MKKTFLLILFAICLTPLLSSGQSTKEVDSTLTYYTDKINNLSDTASQFLRDALVPVNKDFANYIRSTCIKNSTLIAKYSKQVSAGLSVETSPDKNFKIYTWNFRVNDTIRSPSSVIQYKTDRDWHTTVFIDTIKTHWNVPFISQIIENIQIKKTADKKTIYIVLTTMMLDATTFYETVHAFIIDKNVLISYPFFQAAQKYQAKISIQVDWNSPNKFHTKTEEGFIIVDKKGNILIPMLDNMVPTGKFLTYKFNGYRFVYDKNAKG